MALVLSDRVKETTTTSGTYAATSGIIALGGAVAAFQTFAAGVGNTNTTYYTILDADGTSWEVGLGTLNSDSTTLTRTTILQSTNSDAGITLSSGTHTVFSTYPADKSVHLDGSGDVIIGVDGTGRDVKFFGDTVSSYMLYDQSEDNLIVQVGDIIVRDSSGNTKIAMDSTGTLVLGVDGDRQIRVDNESGPDENGKILDLRGGKSTGTGTGGSVRLYTGTTGGSSNSNSNAHAVALTLDATQAATFAGVATFNKATKAALKTNTDGAAVEFDLDEANVHTITLGDGDSSGDRTFSIINEDAGQKFIIRMLQDGTGSRTVTWFSTIKWAGGSAPTLTTTPSKADVVGFLVTGTDTYDGFVVGQNI